MWRIPEIIKFQVHFREYKITVYQAFAYEDITFEGQVDSPKQINLLYDDVERHYSVIVNLTRAIARRYVCKACKYVTKSLARRYAIVLLNV